MTESDPAPGEPVGWLLGEGTSGAALTQTGALSRALVREAALRWPQWWRAELFGPPHREAELPMLTELRQGLVRMRLMRRQGRTLRTTRRGLRALEAPGELMHAVREDMLSAGGIDAGVWIHLCDILREGKADGVEALVVERALLDVLDDAGWLIDTGQHLDERDLWFVLHPIRCRGEAYGLIASTRGEAGAPWRLRLLDADAVPSR